MRCLAALVLVVALQPDVALADPPRPSEPKGEAGVAAAVDRFHVGADTHWTPDRFEDRLGLGLGWRVPRRWYDADGALLTERSLLDPGRDLERPGLYLALKF
jgi:hypothetical protein